MAGAAPITREPWPKGARAQNEKTILNMAKYIAVGSRSDGIRSRLAQALDAAGIPRSARPSVREMAAAADAWVTENVRYASDPVLAELIQDPRVTACTADAPGGACTPMEDCDGHVVLVLAMLASVGVEVRIVAITYAPSVQPHVKGAAKDESGRWLRIDTTTVDAVGHASRGGTERLIDPFDPKIAPPGIAGGEYIGVGKAPSYVPESPTYLDALYGRRVGAGATPMDILRYRAMWDQFVLDTVRSANECAGAFAALAAQQSDPKLKANLASQGQAIQTQSSDILQLWNTWHDQSDASIVVNAADILKSQQDVVLDAGNLRQQMTQGPLTCALSYHDAQGNIVQATPGPDESTQAQVIAYLEGLGILAAGTLQVLGRAGGGALQTVGDAAQYLAKGSSWILSPWTWGIAGTLLVGTVVVVVYNADKVGRLVAAARPGVAELRRKKKKGRLAA